MSVSPKQFRLPEGFEQLYPVFNKLFENVKHLRVEGPELFFEPDVNFPDQTITDANIRDSAGVSVIGRASSVAGTPADIAASSDGQFLSMHSGSLAFSAITDADIPSGIARDTEITAAVAAHVAAVDPHTQYVLESTILNGSATYDPPSLIAGAGATTTVTVTGAVLGNFALASFSLDLQGLTVTAYVSAADTVSVRFQNQTAGTLDLASGTLRARVWT